MLTESEREWLEDREWFRHPYACKWCDRYDPLLFFPANKSIPCKWYQSCTSLNCPSQPDLLDALEFSERVATKLAGILDRTLRSRDYTLHADCTRVCPAATDCTKNNRLGLDCAPYLLKWARLAVEEEMDGKWVFELKRMNSNEMDK